MIPFLTNMKVELCCSWILALSSLRVSGNQSEECEADLAVVFLKVCSEKPIVFLEISKAMNCNLICNLLDEISCERAGSRVVPKFADDPVEIFEFDVDLRVVFAESVEKEILQSVGVIVSGQTVGFLSHLEVGLTLDRPWSLAVQPPDEHLEWLALVEIFVFEMVVNKLRLIKLLFLFLFDASCND